MTQVDKKRVVLEVEGLRTEFASDVGTVTAVADVDMTIYSGEILGLVGESGSGKSVTGLSIMRLLDESASVSAKCLRFAGTDLLRLPEPAMRRLRGKRIAMVFQDPMMTLNPVLRVGTQMAAAVRAHQDLPTAQVRLLCCEKLALVGIADPMARLNHYPHQFSGGMRQRVAMAIALLHQPDLIIADEPTTALDVTIQAQIVFEMERLCRETGTALLWVTHDLGLVARLADRVSVMYAGRIMEHGLALDVLQRPRHPYTAGLLASIPGQHKRGERLYQMAGSSTTASPSGGCAFEPRCERATIKCRALPPLTTVGMAHEVRCFHPL
jgi:peptide/nickel transport system ATP-binding protein